MHALCCVPQGCVHCLVNKCIVCSSKITVNTVKISSIMLNMNLSWMIMISHDTLPKICYAAWLAILLTCVRILSQVTTLQWNLSELRIIQLPKTKNVACCWWSFILWRFILGVRCTRDFILWPIAIPCTFSTGIQPCSNTLYQYNSSPVTIAWEKIVVDICYCGVQSIIRWWHVGSKTLLSQELLRDNYMGPFK